METAMVFRILAIFVLGALCVPVLADELDEPPPMDEDPRCLARKAADEAYLRSIANFPVAKGRPCPPNPETVRQREVACRAENENSRLWKFISDGFESGSSMLSKGVPFVVEALGEPLREEQGEGYWDIDIYEVPRTLYFSGVTVETRDYVDDVADFNLENAQIKSSNAIYEMLLESGKFKFAHGLTLESTREEVEAALELPCESVARYGRTAVRKEIKYSYTDTSDRERSRYSVTFNFSDASRIETVRWHFRSAWH
jgi:hypothetical protein